MEIIIIDYKSFERAQSFSILKASRLLLLYMDFIANFCFLFVACLYSRHYYIHSHNLLLHTLIINQTWSTKLSDRCVKQK